MEGRSAAPEAVAKLPPMVALFCTAGAPLRAAASQRRQIFFDDGAADNVTVGGRAADTDFTADLLMPLSSLTLRWSMAFEGLYCRF